MTETETTTEISTEGVFFGEERYLRNRPFLVILEWARPGPAARTEKKGWMDVPGLLQRFEQPSIVDRVSKNHLTRAAFIIDIINRKLVKNRYPDAASDEEFVTHYMNKYSEQITRGIEVWAQNVGLSALADSRTETPSEEEPTA